MTKGIVLRKTVTQNFKKMNVYNHLSHINHLPTREDSDCLKHDIIFTHTQVQNENQNKTVLFVIFHY